MILTRRLRKAGNSLALTFDKPLLEALGIDERTPLELITDGGDLLIRPKRSAREQRFREAAMHTFRVHRETLRKLAE